jgi:hypothetical protein
LLAVSEDGVCAGETWELGDDVELAGAGDGLLLVAVGCFVQLLTNIATMQPTVTRVIALTFIDSDGVMMGML